MYTINFQKPEHIHFIGIGGISMSGLAEVLLQRGLTRFTHGFLRGLRRIATHLTATTRPIIRASSDT